MTRFASLLKRFRRDESGVFLIIFALLSVVLIATSGAVVDFSRVQQARTKAQNALDAAALALSAEVGKTGVTAATIKAQAQLLLTERVGDSSITSTVIDAVPDEDNGKLTLTAFVNVPTYFVRLIGFQTVRANMLSEVVRSSSNIEVAVAADITYSMLGSRIEALKSALKTTVGIIVKTDQTPTYSKMAIAPYSNGVNVGSYAEAVRGTIVPGRTISSLTYQAGNNKTISGITRASEGVITVNNLTNLQNDDWVYIYGVSGMTQINGRVGQVTSRNTSNNTFKLKISGTNLCTSSSNPCNFSSYTGGGTVAECTRANCREVVTTTSAHNITDGAYAVITGTSGTTNVNNVAWQTDYLTATTYELVGSTPANGTSTVGSSYCTLYGCEFYRYDNAAGGKTTFKVTPCAVERTTTTYASLDTSPVTAPVGIQYATIANSDYPGSITLEACPEVAIQPLTSDKTTLTDLVDDFAVQGSTAGHIGLAWAWYMLSPTFTTPIAAWPTLSRPANYNDTDTIKAIILMTDGEFNTMYNFGVPARNSDLANSTTRSNVNAPLGTSLEQGEDLCTEIKKPAYNIKLYTIGFGISSGSAADTFLSGCASSTSMYKTASDAATLTQAFKDIANELSNLRVSR